jgi:hypothetical protein
MATKVPHSDGSGGWLKTLRTEPEWNVRGNAFIVKVGENWVVKPYSWLGEQVLKQGQGTFGTLRVVAVILAGMIVGAATGTVFVIMMAIKVVIVVGIHLAQALCCSDRMASLIKIFPSIFSGGWNIAYALLMLLPFTFQPLTQGLEYLDQQSQTGTDPGG